MRPAAAPESRRSARCDVSSRTVTSPRDRRKPSVRDSAQPRRSLVWRTMGSTAVAICVIWLQLEAGGVGDHDQLPAHRWRMRGQPGDQAPEVIRVVLGHHLDRCCHGRGLIQPRGEVVGVRVAGGDRLGRQERPDRRPSGPSWTSQPAAAISSRNASARLQSRSARAAVRWSMRPWMAAGGGSSRCIDGSTPGRDRTYRVAGGHRNLTIRTRAEPTAPARCEPARGECPTRGTRYHQ